MRRTRQSSIIRFDTILWILLVILGLFVFNKTDDKSRSVRQSDQAELSAARYATLTTVIQYSHFQKIWILNKDNFRILTFDHTKFLDNNKEIQKIFAANKDRTKSVGFFIPLIIYYYPPEKSDELPVLS